MSDDEDRDNEQVRVSFRLASDCNDESLRVPSDAMAIPSHLGRKGLSTVINHLLDRRLPNEDEEEDSDEDEREKALPFEFLVGEGNRGRLLRTSLEKEARQNGLSLEDALVVTYFPAQQKPELQGQEPPLPDWISGLSFTENSLFVACYDGSLRYYGVEQGSGIKAGSVVQSAHESPIKCVRSFAMNGSLWTASGSMDQTLALHSWPTGQCSSRVVLQATVTSVDEKVTENTKAVLATGDWDGAVLLWDVDESDVTANETSSKKLKTSGKERQHSEEPTYAMTTKVSLQAHQSKVSGVAWGNHSKKNGFSNSQMVTGSWDHSIKVWDMETQDCLLTLNGSKVVACMDTSYHTAGIVATGHPDCVVRLWDVRTDQTTNSLVTDSVFRPSHRAWVSQVQWSEKKPYQVLSTSHDGTLKVWDIRAALPLHTVRTCSKEDKVLALTMGDVNEETMVFTGGSDCQLNKYHLDGLQDDKAEDISPKQ